MVNYFVAKYQIQFLNISLQLDSITELFKCKDTKIVLIPRIKIKYCIKNSMIDPLFLLTNKK